MSVPVTMMLGAAYIDLCLTVCVVVYALRSSAALNCAKNMDIHIYHAFNIIIFTSMVHILSLGSVILASTLSTHFTWKFISNLTQNTVYLLALRCVKNDWFRCKMCCVLHGETEGGLTP